MNKIIAQLLIFGFIIYGCTSNNYMDEQDFIERLEFSPRFHTQLDSNQLDSVLVMEIHNGQLTDSSWEKTYFNSDKIDKPFEFEIKRKLKVGVDYEFNFVLNDSLHINRFTEIEYDTIPVYNGYIWTTTSYRRNGTKVIGRNNCNYAID